MGEGTGNLEAVDEKLKQSLLKGLPAKVKLKNGKPMSWLYGQFGRYVGDDSLRTTYVVMLHPLLYRDGTLRPMGDVYNLNSERLLSGVYLDRFRLAIETPKTFESYL